MSTQQPDRAVASDRHGQRIPNHIAVTIGLYLSNPRSLCFLATLFFAPTVQASAFRRIYDHSKDEFDAAAAKPNCIELLDRLLAYCKLFNLAPRYTNKVVYKACRDGHMHILKWWNNSGLDPKPDKVGFQFLGDPMDVASRNGHVAVLQWLMSSGWPMMYSESAMDDASMMGHVHVLQWWKDSGLPLKYYNCMAFASSNNHILVLQWWKDSGLPMTSRVNNVDSVDSVEVLEWWAQSGLEMRCSRALDTASLNGRVHILEWWKSSKLELRYTSYAMDKASQHGHVPCLQWWKDSNLELQYTSSPDVLLYTPDAVQWWIESGLTIKINEQYVVRATAQGRVDVLQLWKIGSGPGIVYTEKPLDCALLCGNISALQWWKKSGLTLKFTSSVTKQLGKRSIARRWLKENGLIDAN